MSKKTTKYISEGRDVIHPTKREFKVHERGLEVPAAAKSTLAPGDFLGEIHHRFGFFHAGDRVMDLGGVLGPALNFEWKSVTVGDCQVEAFEVPVYTKVTFERFAECPELNSRVDCVIFCPGELRAENLSRNAHLELFEALVLRYLKPSGHALGKFVDAIEASRFVDKGMGGRFKEATFFRPTKATRKNSAVFAVLKFFQARS